jgi:3'-phosphoadenosine 5'-phosphosulfate sulfotransferase (PAPS reductase)/FAD synthetase
MTTRQTAFQTKEERTREIFRRAKEQDLHNNSLILAVSGGLDSIVAADVTCRIGSDYGFSPDAVAHINTGASVPQSRLTAKILAAIHDIDFIEQGYRNEADSLAVRILDNGWPGGYVGSPWTGGHGLEWANRKDKPMNAVYMQFDGRQTWVSGVRKLESKRRSGNVADSAIEQDKPRRTWISPILGWTDQDKQDYIIRHNLPVSEAYLVLGFSAECVACSFDDSGLLTDLDLLAPELSYAIRSLAVWLFTRVRAGEIDLAPKRLQWGWNPDEAANEAESQTQELIGCSAGSCATKNAPEWIRDLEPDQIVDRQDVLRYWEEDIAAIADRYQ